MAPNIQLTPSEASACHQPLFRVAALLPVSCDDSLISRSETAYLSTKLNNPNQI